MLEAQTKGGPRAPTCKIGLPSCSRDTLHLRGLTVHQNRSFHDGIGQVAEDGSGIPGVVAIQDCGHWTGVRHLALDWLQAHLESTGVCTRDGAEGIEEAAKVGASMRPNNLHHHAALALTVSLPAGTAGCTIAVDLRVGDAHRARRKVLACRRWRLQTPLRYCGIFAGTATESRDVLCPKSHGRHDRLSRLAFVQLAPPCL
mmetsp:Transcript_46191/g.107906  ORF Transcript_46191/g.107906 Transcript_46191/m.107906 type:complete len:201 (-) Transcript_46191:161-763(-)